MKIKIHPLFSLLLILIVICLVIVCFTRISISSSNDKFILINDGKSHKIPIYCINLPSETKRRDHIIYTFGDIVEFVDAVDTRNDKWYAYSHYLTEEGLKQMKRSEMTNTRRAHYELSPGAIGCFLSHIKCWNKFLETNPDDNDFVFILEDDTQPTATFDKTYSKIINEFPPKCDILLCSYLAKGNTNEENYGGVDYVRLLPYSQFYLTNAMFITARGIKKIFNDLAQKDNKFYKQIDSYLTDLLNDNVINVMMLKEKGCHQVGITASSIQIYSVS